MQLLNDRARFNGVTRHKTPICEKFGNTYSLPVMEFLSAHGPVKHVFGLPPPILDSFTVGPVGTRDTKAIISKN